MKRYFIPTILSGLALSTLGTGCHQPTNFAYTGPRVYLIKGTPNEVSDGLYELRDELNQHEIAAAVYSPDDWLKIVNTIDAKPDEEAILVGHGHGGFLATQVVRHYAQEHKMKFMKHVIVIDDFNKDWPYAETNAHNPEAAPLGHNSRRADNFLQKTAASEIHGTTLISTRNSNVAEEHPYYWYDNYWDGKAFTGQKIATTDVTNLNVDHESIDNNKEVLDRILTLCRRSALSPFHYTPVRHHPYVTQAPDNGQYGQPTQQAQSN